MELLSVKSDFFARGFNNPGLMESQEKSLRMAGCSKAAMEAVKAYLYTGEMDFRQLRLDTLLYVMNVSREILIEEELFNGIETYIKNMESTMKKSNISKIMEQTRILPKSLMLLESFKLDNLMDLLLKHTNVAITDFTWYTKNAPTGTGVHIETVNKIRRSLLKELKSLPKRIMRHFYRLC